MTLEEALLGLNLNGCPATKVGRSSWTAPCPLCGSPDGLRLHEGRHGLVGVRCTNVCSRPRLLDLLGLEDNR